MTQSVEQKFVPAGPQLLDYVARKEPWCEYELEDGTVVRIRVTLVRAEATGQFIGADHPEIELRGCPLHNLKTNMMMDVIFPEHVKQEARKRLGG